MQSALKGHGAPRGSVYHRFAGRTALLAEVWLRTVERFQAGYLAVLTGGPDAHRAARAASRHVVAWCRENPAEAALLLYGAADLAAPTGRRSTPNAPTPVTAACSPPRAASPKPWAPGTNRTGTASPWHWSTCR
ncbi:hypothetical protein GCM10010275_46960 [Streptomyces litmocidini]|nr:hypothetical protein GCM10010275_46960 [Streptomyces litmocidini]